MLWEASERVCSKRLRPLIPILLPALERHGRLGLDDALRSKLLTVSPATIDRLLTEVRIVARGGQRRRAGMSSAVRRSVPVRTFGDWNDPPPGFVEVDFVAHSGTSSSGSFVQTMVLTDIATGWTECVPVRTRDSGNVIMAIKQARSRFPFPLLGVDFDNDSAFMNALVVSWCRSEDLEVTRCRAYRKNDQAHVEQKNGAIVRRLVGYGRFVGTDATAALECLYAVVRLNGNLFQPSFKLQEKTRIGARVIKRYHPPIPPAARVLAHPNVAEADKERLRALLEDSRPGAAVCRHPRCTGRAWKARRSSWPECENRGAIGYRSPELRCELENSLEERRDTANASPALSADQTLAEKTQHVRALRGADQGMAEGRPSPLGSRRAATAEGNRSSPLQRKEHQNGATAGEGLAHGNGWAGHPRWRLDRELAAITCHRCGSSYEHCRHRCLG